VSVFCYEVVSVLSVAMKLPGCCECFHVLLGRCEFVLNEVARVLLCSLQGVFMCCYEVAGVL